MERDIAASGRVIDVLVHAEVPPTTIVGVVDLVGWRGICRCACLGISGSGRRGTDHGAPLITDLPLRGTDRDAPLVTGLPLRGADRDAPLVADLPLGGDQGTTGEGAMRRAIDLSTSKDRRELD